ncbi:MAG: hypothetical protein KIC64_04985 [Prevotella buccae]|uniref:hypothetical protein n=1 Tax=Segatella buccae TaxID=28126 RepID=UPI0001C415E9|nr:hypothetical protein [Segatella buccae]EFC75154.1 hypothetical protein HMPREF0649_01848 [Segatella buccae D17]MBS5895162.1 hypothetical protein [Segatella buccae]
MRNYEKGKVEELETMLQAGRLTESRMEFSVSSRNGKACTKVKLINEVEVAGMILSFDALEKIAKLKVCRLK